MNDNPVWRESYDIYFAEGHGLAVYFYMLIILAPVEFLALFVPSLDVQQWSGAASLFKVTAITALMLMVYFALRVANQEFVPWRFKSIKYWLGEAGQSPAAVSRAQMLFLAAHIGLSLLLSAPLLAWAGAIARTGNSLPVYFMRGNRDFLVGERFARACRATILEDPARVDLHGTPALLMHGDTLCLGDIEYQAFRKTVRDPKAPGGARFEPELVHNRSGIGSSFEVMDINKDGAPDISVAGAYGAYVFLSKAPARPAAPAKK